MKSIGNDGEVIKEDYKVWPLFWKIRKSEKFKETFKQIFNEEYNVIESPKRPVQELFIKRKKEKKEELNLKDRIQNLIKRTQ